MTVSPRVKQHVAEDARRVRGDAEVAEAAADYLPGPATAVSGCFAMLNFKVSETQTRKKYHRKRFRGGKRYGRLNVPGGPRAILPFYPVVDCR
jgi:hypothetical protein